MLCCFRILYKSCVIVEFNFGGVLFHDFLKYISTILSLKKNFMKKEC